jgi:hypothetical protein
MKLYWYTGIEHIGKMVLLVFKQFCYVKKKKFHVYFEQ